MAKQARTAKNAQKGTPPPPPGGVPFSHFSFVGALFGVALNSS